MDALTKQVQQLGISGSKKESTAAVKTEEPVLVSAVRAQSFIQWLAPVLQLAQSLSNLVKYCKSVALVASHQVICCLGASYYRVCHATDCMEGGSPSLQG